MSLFRRKKTANVDPFLLMGSSVRVDAAMLLDVLDSARGGDAFGPSFTASSMFAADFLGCVHVLKLVGSSPEEWYFASNLQNEWEHASRAARAELCTKTAQFSNMLDEAEYEDIESLVLHAMVRLKVLLLAYGCDGIYGTALLQQLASDPMSFGVHEMSG